MKKIILSIAAAAALSAGAAPAMAQSRGSGFDSQIGSLQQQFDRGLQRGTIPRNEAQPLRTQLTALTRLERQYARRGFTTNERRSLQQRIQTLRQRIQAAASNGNRRR